MPLPQPEPKKKIPIGEILKAIAYIAGTLATLFGASQIAPEAFKATFGG